MLDGRVHAQAALHIEASPERLARIYLDYARWPQLFPETILGTALQSRDARAIHVQVEHRTAGRVLNVLRPRSAREVALFEVKPRYEATFLNRFEPDGSGTRYAISAEVRLRGPYRLLAPLLAPYVRRALRRYVLRPMRAYAQRVPA